MLLPREISIVTPKLKSGSKHAPSRTSTQPMSSIPRAKFEGPTPDTLHTPTDDSSVGKFFVAWHSIYLFKATQDDT